jgi:hypothetical protein
VVVLRPTITTLVGVLGFVAVAAGCSGRLAPGNRETDRIANVVSDAISYPRQDSAAGYARAALATRAGQDGRLRVLAIEELKAGKLGDPLGRLVFLIHLEGSEAGWTISRPVTACYKAEFSFYGVVGSPPEDGLPAGCHARHAAADPAAADPDRDSRRGGRGRRAGADRRGPDAAC